MISTPVFGIMTVLVVLELGKWSLRVYIEVEDTVGAMAELHGLVDVSSSIGPEARVVQPTIGGLTGTEISTWGIAPCRYGSSWQGRQRHQSFSQKEFDTVVAFDVDGDFALFDQVEDCCADFCHGDDAWPHVDKHTGGIGQYVVFVVGSVINADGDFSERRTWQSLPFD